MNPGKLPSEVLEDVQKQQPLIFEYAILDSKTQMLVQEHTIKIKKLMHRTAQDIIDIGQKLIEVKQYLGHGNFIRWLKSEFNWSVSTATKFMQVGEQFKFINFTNLNITASALYLVAAPSTPKEARAEVLERASIGENISYTKAKAIIYNYKKTAKPRCNKLSSIEVYATNTKSQSSEFIEPLQYKIPATFSRQEDLTGKEVKTQTLLLPSSEDIQLSVELENKQIVNNIKDLSFNNTQVIESPIVNTAVISCEISEPVIAEIAIIIKKMTPEELALAIKISASNGLNNQQLEALIITSQNILNNRNTDCKCLE